MRMGSTSTPELGTVEIEYANGLQTAGKLELVELWILARARKAANVYKRFDAICNENLIELL